MIENSRNLKISVYINFINPEAEEEGIQDVCILLLQCKNILRGRIFGRFIDETDDDLKNRIITEEIGEEFLDTRMSMFGVRNIDTSIPELVIENVFDTMKTFKSVIMRMDGSTDEDDQFVIYHDNIGPSNSEFWNELYDYIMEHDDTLLPTTLRDIFPFGSDIKTIFEKYGYENIKYIESSSASNALFSGIAFDLSLGYR